MKGLNGYRKVAQLGPAQRFPPRGAGSERVWSPVPGDAPFACRTPGWRGRNYRAFPGFLIGQRAGVSDGQDFTAGAQSYGQKAQVWLAGVSLASGS
jgi:hypothetical protein